MAFVRDRALNKSESNGTSLWGFDYCGVATYFLYITKKKRKEKLKYIEYMNNFAFLFI